MGTLLAATRRMGFKRTIGRLGGGLALCLALHQAGYAQETLVPIDVQVSVLTRVLMFDRAQPDRVADGLVVGIAYQPRNRASMLARTDFEASFRGVPSKFVGASVRFVAVDMGTEEALADILRREGVDILYVTPLRAVDMADVVRATREAGVLSCSGQPEHVEGGVALGVGQRDGRPEIIINMPSARAEGARFSSEVLRLARLVGGGP